MKQFIIFATVAKLLTGCATNTNSPNATAKTEINVDATVSLVPPVEQQLPLNAR